MCASKSSLLENSSKKKVKVRTPKSTLVGLKIQFEAGRPRLRRLTRRDGHSDLDHLLLPGLLLWLCVAPSEEKLEPL